jgi:hypothetical protein
MKLFLTILFALISESLIGQNYVALKGEFMKPTSLTTLLLYKYNSIIDSEFIENIPIKDNKLSVFKSLNEVDSYYIEEPISGHSFLFIWDGTIEILVDSISFYNSKLSNSPLTDSLNSYYEGEEEIVFHAVRNVDDQIKKLKGGDKNKLNELNIKRDSLIDESKKKLITYRKEYVKRNPSSFISLYLLTMMGFHDESTIDELNMMQLLSNNLKKHSRYVRFQE